MFQVQMVVFQVAEVGKCWLSGGPASGRDHCGQEGWPAGEGSWAVWEALFRLLGFFLRVAEIH